MKCSVLFLVSGKDFKNFSKKCFTNPYGWTLWVKKVIEIVMIFITIFLTNNATSTKMVKYWNLLLDVYYAFH